MVAQVAQDVLHKGRCELLSPSTPLTRCPSETTTDLEFFDDDILARSHSEHPVLKLVP